MTLIIKNLSKTYNQRRILSEISFEVKNSEIFGIFGVAGAGKSTLIRAIAGNINCDAGTIHYGDEDRSSIHFKDRGFYFPQLTNSIFWRNLFKTEKPSELADGDGQALALDEALANAENVLLLDNQFCFMDRERREQQIAHLKKVVKEKKLVVVFATNDFEEILTICDRVAVLHQGRILQSGTPREIYETPNSATVANVTGRNNVIRSRRISSSKSETPQFVTVEAEHLLVAQRTAKNNLSAINQDLFLAIRPEHISISFGASFPEDNLLKAVITAINYLGANTLLDLDAGGLRLKALVMRLVGLNIGDECMVGLPPDRILVLKN